jgi:acetyl-CoA carboxylase biotin carboxyl carrier protein
VLTFEQITELVELVAKRRLQRFELEQSDFHLTIEGQATVVTVSEAAAPPSATVAHPAPSVAPSGPASDPPTAEAAADGHVLTSPIVGTFYRAPSPDAPSFVEVGSRVSKGQVLCIVEAMKLMNEIESDADGVITRIYPQNAQPVEFGEPLFVIKAG